MSSRSKNNNKNLKRSNRTIYSERKEGHIPPISSNVTIRHKFRFIAQSAVNVKITNNDILASLGSVCYVVNSSGLSIAETYRIKSVEVWAPIASQGTAATCSVEWSPNTTATNYSSSLQVSDTSINPQSPAHVRCRPPKGSVASFWQEPSAGSLNLLAIIAPAGSVVDVFLEYVLVDDNSNRVPTTYASASAVLGYMYYGYLDNYESNPPLLKPVSLTPNF